MNRNCLSKWRVSLYYMSDRNLPYIINDLEASDKIEAVRIAKSMVADMGYFPGFQRKDFIMEHLHVISVHCTEDNTVANII